MALLDSELTVFAYTVAGMAGGFLAISAGIWIFLFDRRAKEEDETRQRLRTVGSTMYDYLSQHLNNPSNYLMNGDKKDYTAFLHDVVLASRPLSGQVPSYLQWREDTKGIANRSRAQDKIIDQAQQLALAGGAWSKENEGKRAFQTSFLDYMNDSDLEIQHLDWVVGIIRKGASEARRLLWLAAAVVGMSLSLGLAASTESTIHIPNSANLYVALILLANVGLLLYVLMRTFKANSVSASEWIEMRYRQKVKELGVDPDQARREFHERQDGGV